MRGPKRRAFPSRRLQAVGQSIVKDTGTDSNDAGACRKTVKCLMLGAGESGKVRLLRPLARGEWT